MEGEQPHAAQGIDSGTTHRKKFVIVTKRSTKFRSDAHAARKERSRGIGWGEHRQESLLDCIT